MRTICFTSFAYNYLARARVMAKSLKRIHPDWDIWAVITDRPPAGLRSTALDVFDRVIRANALGYPNFAHFAFRHNLVEASTAVKGRMLRAVLREPGVGRAVYLDPDIAVFAPLDPALAAPGKGAIALTPHQASPNTDPQAITDGERTTMCYGVYNLGFLSVANDPTGHAFADWWAARLDEACYDDVAAGLFTDQKFCDLVPGLFPDVRIIRDAGCNVASWNLSQRRLHFDRTGTLLANGVPLRFYHFTKIGLSDAAPAPGDLMTERYAAENIEVYELLAWYKRQVVAEIDPVAQRHPWAYANFADGTPITQAVRRLWRSTPALAARFANPFGDSCRQWLLENHPNLFETA